jgi:DNA-binding transcriptional regulator YhcF (GntR family)
MMTTSASTSTLVDPAYLQRRTLELGREAVEGKRELSALLGDAFQELRAARASIEALQHELRQRDEAAAGVALPSQGPPSAESAPLDTVQPHGRRTMQVPAIVGEKFDAAAGLLDEPLPGEPELLAAWIRSRIEAGLYLGTLRPGDRLPGIREVARRTTISYKVIRRVFHALEREALVEIRDRSGIYVAAARSSPTHLLEGTESWVAEVLVEAMERGLGADALCARIQQWTVAHSLRCACVESLEDDRFAIANEVLHRFGMETVYVHPDQEDLAAELRRADVVVTTPFHARNVRAVLGMDGPLVVAHLHPSVVESLRQAAGSGSSVMICADPASGERLLQGLRGELPSRIRVVGVDEATQPGWLEACGPAVMTPAARERLGGATPPAGIRVLRYLAPQSGHRIASLLIDRNRSEAPRM